MPDCGRPAEENERRLQTASYRDPPPNNYGMQLLERSLPPEQQQQQQSGGRKRKGGIMSPENYKGKPVNIRPPKWTDSKLWILSEDFEAARYNADAAYYFTGSPAVHFPEVKFDYPPLRLSNGEELTTREECSKYVDKIAKGSAYRGQREDFKKRVQNLILEMVRSPEVVEFLNTNRTSRRKACQPPLEPNPEDPDSPVTDDENGTAVEAGTPREEAIQAFPSTVTLNPSQCGSLVPVAEDTHSVIADDGGEENGTPMEVDSLSEMASEMAIQALAPMGTVETAFIPSFEMYFKDEHENFLTSAGQSLGIWHPHLGENVKEDLVPDNFKEFFASLDKDEEDARKANRTLGLGAMASSPTICPLLAAFGS